MGHAKLLEAALRYRRPQPRDAVHRYQAQALDRDLSQSRERDKLVEQIKQGMFDAIVISPPCSTFSRACWANHRGPRPVRSYKSPKGLDTLTAAAPPLHLGQHLCRFYLGGRDFDLRYAPQSCPPGATGRSGRYGNAGERPASMWQWPAFADIMAKPDWKTFAFHQGNFGAGYPKPTRLLIFC